MTYLKQTAFALLLAGTSLAALAGPQCTPHPESERIAPQQFQQQLKQQGYEIRRFKLSDNCYEIYGKNRQGQKVEIYFDTKTGQAVKTEIDD